MADAATTNIPKDTHNSTRCRLLELPAELRLMIYEEAFRILRLDWASMSKTRTPQVPALLGTCRTLRVEARHVYRARMSQELAVVQKQRDDVGAEIQAFDKRGKETSNPMVAYWADTRFKKAMDKWCDLNVECKMLEWMVGQV